MSVPNRKPWTYELCSLLPEDGKRHEVIDGELYLTPSPKIRHQELVLRLAVELELAVREEVRQGEPRGRVLEAPCDVCLAETSVVQPDVLYVSPERAGIVAEANIQGAPDLVVEVLSESTRKIDEVLKRELYERFGVLEYWIVDPELESVKVWCQMNEAEFGQPVILERVKRDALRTQLLPSLSIALDTLFASP